MTSESKKAMQESARLAEALGVLEAAAGELRDAALKWRDALRARLQTAPDDALERELADLESALATGAGEAAVREIAGARGATAAKYESLRVTPADYLLVHVRTNAQAAFVAPFIQKILANLQPQPRGIMVVPAGIDTVEVSRLPEIKKKLIVALADVEARL